ncbi:hypothetical protein Ppa06_69540 [Planomonospora parontospora subsp. parontospora]|uniref:AB hydrolase-1 domain-containing protein n=2 Tax=Planomonospora parontospora TaxID=58119 RepID=A0AA37BMM4_9ACTN|nr:alpha/beta hydrolase [Planomonospora parontospora]GGK91904.1 hypothetical protein GCM10010126_59100 [Planomonospora parontospora]GII13156.1 hypothetical protein Ppa06_69540 [Planomonospora parontospora subsp. parontospora]
MTVPEETGSQADTTRSARAGIPAFVGPAPVPAEAFGRQVVDVPAQDGEHRVSVRFGGPAGSGRPPTLLLHGLVLSGRYLMPSARRLAASRLVVVPDMPGCGDSPHPDVPLGIDQLAVIARGLLKEVGEPAAVIANSFGCLIAVELAIRHPEAVRCLIMAGPPARPGLPGIALRWMSTAVREPPALWPIGLQALRRTGLRQAAAHLRMARRYPLRQRLTRVTAPVLVVRGLRDHLASRGWAQELASACPQGVLIETDAVHTLPYEIPELITSLVDTA